jgi:hypothetical protein
MEIINEIYVKPVVLLDFFTATSKAEKRHDHDHTTRYHNSSIAYLAHDGKVINFITFFLFDLLVLCIHFDCHLW